MSTNQAIGETREMRLGRHEKIRKASPDPEADGGKASTNHTQEFANTPDDEDSPSNRDRLTNVIKPIMGKRGKWIVLTIVVTLILLTSILIFLFAFSKSSTQEPSSFAVPAQNSVESQPATQVQQAPPAIETTIETSTETTLPDNIVLPEKFSLLPEKYRATPWFIQGEDKFQIYFNPPNSLQQVSKNIGWAILLLLGFQLVRSSKAEAEERGEAKDFKLLKIGLLVALFTFAFGSGLAETLSTWIKWLKPEAYSGDLTQYVLWGIGGAIAFGFFIGAAFAGEDDFTPPGVGLFLLGLMLKLFFTQPVIIPTVGSWLMAAGIVIVIAELFRQHGTTAILLVIVAWAIGGIVGSIIGVAFWGLPKLVEPLSTTAINNAPILAFVYKTRLVIGWIVGYLTGSAFLANTLGLGGSTKSLKVRDGSQVGQLIGAGESERFDGKILFQQSVIAALIILFM